MSSCINTTTSDLEEVRAEVESVIELTNPGKSVDELMEQYRGREDELIENLRRHQDQSTDASR